MAKLSPLFVFFSFSPCDNYESSHAPIITQHHRPVSSYYLIYIPTKLITICKFAWYIEGVRAVVFNATFNIISVILW
jgi:hypothetical protein